MMETSDLFYRNSSEVSHLRGSEWRRKPSAAATLSCRGRKLLIVEGGKTPAVTAKSTACIQRDRERRGEKGLKGGKKLRERRRRATGAPEQALSARTLRRDEGPQGVQVSGRNSGEREGEGEGKEAAELN